jgi:hypothetical protein
VRVLVTSFALLLAAVACGSLEGNEVAPVADGGGIVSEGGASDAGADGGSDADDGGADAAIGTLQLPANAATDEGNSSNSSPFGGAGQRFQSVYGQALLTALPQGAVITGIRFRLDSSAASFPQETIDNLEIRLSTSKNPPGALSPDFTNNRGADEVIVRAGPLTIEPADYPSGATPNAFGKRIDFNLGSFTYRGGPLLLEVGATAAPSARNVDNVSPSSQESQTVYGDGFSATAATGNPYFDLIVVEYTFEYP